MARAGRLIGRQVEIEAIAHALDDPSCDGVALVGAPGVGKSLLAHYAGTLAAERGLVTAQVRATVCGSSVPYSALSPFFSQFDIQIVDHQLAFGDVAAGLQTASPHPPVIVVDDAHELDDASAALVDQLVDAGCIFVVLTVQQGAPRGVAMLDMWKDLRVRRIQVDPLPDESIREVAAYTLDAAVESATLRELVGASAGNALFLRELIAGALESGALRKQYGIWRLEGSLTQSERLRDLIERRLIGLEEVERSALELVAIGEPLRLSVLEPLVGVDVVERLESRRLLDARADGPDPEVRLSHPLVGDIVRTSLPAVRRARLSRQLADAVEGAGEVHGTELLRVALWRLDGGGANPETITPAARAAFRSEDYVLAERLARAGWEGWRRIDAAMVLGEVLDLLGRAEEADELLAEAFELATNDHERTSLAIRRASLLFRSLGRADDAERVVADAVALVKDPSCQRELNAIQGDHLLLAGDVARAIELDEPLLRGPMDAAFAQAALDVGTALVLAGRTEEAIARTSAALAVRLDLDEELHLSRTGVYVVAHSMALAGAGRLAEASSMAEVAYDAAVERHMVDGQAWLGAVLASIKLAQGQLQRAANLFGEVTSLFNHLKHPGKRWGLGGIALATGQMGDRATSEAAIRELETMAMSTVRLMDVSILRGRAWAAVAGQDLATARQTLWDAHDLAARWGQWAGAAEVLFDLIRIGERGAALSRLAELERQVDGDLMAARVTHAKAVGHHDAGGAHEAAEQFESIGALLFAAESAMLEYRLASRTGKHRQASAAAVWAERLRTHCQGARTPALAASPEADSLSIREREVALLAASGLTSREIATRLFVSKRTIDNHLQRIYTKLGIAGRHELADRLGELGTPPTLASEAVPS